MTRPRRISEDGVFPFGIPNGPRDWTWEGPGTPDQLVIGVYPSAVHVRWRPPPYVAPGADSRGVAGNLPVAPEPTVFWTGRDPSEADAVRAWRDDVGFRDGVEAGCHGTLSNATNGPSGDRLDHDYFPGLPFTRERTAFLDVYPVYQVKSRPGKNRGQWEAIEQEYNSIVGQLPAGRRGRLEPSELPRRLSKAQLPVRAVERFGGWLVEALHELAPSHVVTLGEEPWHVLTLLDGITAAAPATGLTQTATRYGEPGTLAIEGRRVVWTPLVHPGLLALGKATQWSGIHQQWLTRIRGQVAAQPTVGTPA